MIRALLSACVVAAAAMAMPASSGLKSPLAEPAGASEQGSDRVATAPSSSSPAAPAAPISKTPGSTATSDTGTRATLSIVPPRNPKLESRLRPLLPSNMTMQQAAKGFVNQHQFVSAVHVSRNLDIPFALLKSKIVDERLTLGQAIQVLRPDADVSKELRRARDLTARDLY
jgi:hypothetical protein